MTVPCSICAQTLLYTEEMSGKRDAYCANKTHLLGDTKMGLKTFCEKKCFQHFCFEGFFEVVLLIRFWDCVCLAVPFCLAIIAENYFQIAFQVFCFLFCSSKCNRSNKDVCCYKRFIFTLEGHLTLIGTVLQVSIEPQKHFVKN